jgi:hypothetical protein
VIGSLTEGNISITLTDWVVGRDIAGRSVEATGPRLKVQIEKCMQAASQMMADFQ